MESGAESEDSEESSECSDMDVMEEACERGRAPWSLKDGHMVVSRVNRLNR